MRLMDAKSSPFSSRCRMVIYAKGLKDIEVFEPPGGVFSEAYNAFHRFVKIPLLDLSGDGRDVLLESDVICEYLDELDGNVALKPNDPLLKARMRMLARIADLYVMAPMMTLFKQLDPTTRDTDGTARELSAMMVGYDKLDHFLSGEAYAIGDSLSLADCTLVPSLVLTLDFLPRFDVASPLDTRPKVKSYWKGISGDPVAVRVITEIRDKLAEYRAKNS